MVAASSLDAQVEPRGRTFWLAATTTLAAASAADVAFHRFSADNRSHALDRLTEIGDGLGTGRHLIGAMAASWLAVRITRHDSVARHILHIAVAYTLGNIVVSGLKPMVGRHRPDDMQDAWRFRPFSARGEWHAFPSAHAIHGFTIAAALASETKSRWVSLTAFTAATLVGWSRVYRLEHWPSDVVGAALLGVVSAQTTHAWLHR